MFTDAESLNSILELVSTSQTNHIMTRNKSERDYELKKYIISEIKYLVLDLIDNENRIQSVETETNSQTFSNLYVSYSSIVTAEIVCKEYENTRSAIAESKSSKYLKMRFLIDTMYVYINFTILFRPFIRD